MSLIRGMRDPQIKTCITIHEGILTVELSAHSFARLVECSLSGADVIFSDNYFDLPAPKAVTVTARLPERWDLTMAQAALEVRSVYNTYAG